MFPAKKMMVIKACSDTSAAASKIKHKVLNTSSFFKVSLKTNNRALALALEAQKERRGQLEKEVVYLQKQVEALCFELAARKYQHRKLLHLLKVLHSDTLERLSEAVELLDDLECPEQSEDHGSRLDVAKRSFGRPDPAWSKFPILDFSRGNAAAHADETCRPDANALGGDRQDQVKESSWHWPTDLPGMSSSSVSLGARAEHSHTATPGFDVDATSILKLQEPVSQRLPAESRLPPDSWREKTVLLNTTMEMTVCNDAEIVTVETRAKKTSRPCQAKFKTVRKRSCPKAKGHTARSQETSSPAGQLALTDVRNTAVPEFPPPDMDLEASHIPKLDRHLDQVKHSNPPGSNNATQPDVDESFSVPHGNSLTFVGSDTRGKANKVSSRRSKTKVRKASSFARKTINTPPADHAETSQSTSSAQPPPEGFKSCEADEEGLSESRQAPPVPPDGVNPETGFSAVNYSRGSNKSRLRSTFFVVRDTISSDHVSQDQNPIPPARSGSAIRCWPNNGTKSGKSWKQPWTATEELLGGDGLHGPLLPTDLLSPTGPEVQICKRAKREERSNKTKPRSHVDRNAHKTVHVKNVKKADGDNQEVRPENKVCYDYPEVCNRLSSQACCPSPDTGPGHHCLSHLTISGSTSRFVLPAATRTRELRETFVVFRETSPHGVNGLTSPRHFCAADTAVHGQMADLLTDEPPPWLDTLSSPAAEVEEAAPDLLDSSADCERGGAVEPFPKGQVLTAVTNTMTAVGGEPPGRTKRSRHQVSYKEPPLNRKMRREEPGLTAERGHKKKKTSQPTTCGSPVKD